MASLPDLPSASNPYAGAAAGYASSASSLLNAFNSAARQAAQQQAAAARQKAIDEQAQAQKQFDNEEKIRAAGGVSSTIEADGSPSDSNTGRPTINTAKPQPRPNPAAEGYGNPSVEPVSGRTYVFPSADQKNKTFVPTGGLADALAASTNWDRKTPITATQAHEWLQAVDAAQPKNEPSTLVGQNGDIQDSDGNPVMGFVGHNTGKFTPINMSGGSAGGPFDASASQGPQQPRPQSAQAGDQYNAPANAGPPGYDLSQMGGGKQDGAFTFQPPQKADKPDVSQIIPNVQGPGGGPVIYDKNSQSTKEVALPKGSKAVMTPAQQEADKDRHEHEAERKDASKMKPAEARLIVKTKADGIAKADAEYRKATFADDPTQQQILTPADWKQAIRERNKAYEAVQNEYEESLGAATGNEIPHNDWADKLAASDAAKGTTSQATASPGRGGAKAPAAPAAAAPAAAAPPAITEGTIIRNPKTGARQILRGGAWKPL